MYPIDNRDNEIPPEVSKDTLKELTERFKPKQEPQPQSEQEVRGSAQDLIDRTRQAEQAINTYKSEELKRKISSAKSLGKRIIEGTASIFMKPTSTLGSTTKFSKQGKETDEYRGNKFIYKRKDGSNKKIGLAPGYKKYLSSKGQSLSNFNKYGRPYSTNRYRKSGYRIKHYPLQLSEFNEEQRQALKLAKQRKLLMQQQNIALSQNKFQQRLNEERALNMDIERKRANATAPQGWVRDRVQERQRAIRESHEHTRQNSILKAHENMLSSEENNIFKEVLSTNNTILHAENLFSEDNQRRTNIMRSDRPSILSTREAGNDLAF